METTNKNCPECDNHCPVEDLKCKKGAEHFGVPLKEKDISMLPAEERIIVLLRKCGHHLHHNVGRGADTASLVNVLSEEEKSSLEALLQKCLKHWQESSSKENE